MIVLRNSRRPVMMLIRLPENFESVLDYVKSKVSGFNKWPGRKIMGSGFEKGCRESGYKSQALSREIIILYDLTLMKHV
ncbi:MAG TPA: hypothetical protein ENN91_03925 [Firmicutes bacterium]|nr:hypothetical protein [Bacillota bacterium]